LAQAKALYEAGLVRYQVADFEAAIELWLAAYEKVPDELGAGTIKAEIVYNVATAQERWYDVDQDITHLRKAKRSLEGFAAILGSIYDDAVVEEEQVKARARIAELSERIERAETAARDFELAKAERMRAKFDPVVDERERIRNTGMLGAGATFTVLGGLSLATMGAGIGLVRKAEADVANADEWSELGPRRDALSLGAAGQRMAVIGGVAAGVFVATGVPLLVTGVTFEKKRRAYRSKYALRVAPVVGREVSGIVLSGRF
jgi:tetratricopeptide (TPR) repeat protein